MAGADVQGIFDAVRGHHQASGQFDWVSTHEPKSAPDSGKMAAAIWVRLIRPYSPNAGLAVTSSLLVLTCRHYRNMLQDPQDSIDPNLAAASFDVMARLAANYTLGGLVRNIDLEGASGIGLQSEAGFIPQDQRVYRLMDLTVPCIINDVLPQAP